MQQPKKFMNIRISLILLALATGVTSCTTPSRAFHNTDNTALVIQSLDSQTCRMLQPNTSARESNDQLLAEAKALSQHQTAVIILENYTEEEIGDQFRDRSTPWVVGLRNLGYQHIVFLQGVDVPTTEGLTTIVQYY
jgi:hypothetical protein